VKLISGLYLPTKGTVYVNGIDTRELDREAYYRHESAVFQDTFTLAYSVAENVALNEQWDEEKVWDFPAPFNPTNALCSPLFKEKEMSFNTGFSAPL